MPLLVFGWRGDTSPSAYFPMSQINLNTSSHALLSVFAANGIDRIFQVPGESYIGILDALGDFPSIDVVTCTMKRALASWHAPTVV